MLLFQILLLTLVGEVPIPTLDVSWIRHMPEVESVFKYVKTFTYTED